MSQMTVDQALQLALEHQRVGQLAEAEEIFRQILTVFPDQADAHHLLGALYLQAKLPDKAIEEVNRALELREEPAFFLTRGLVLQSLGHLDESLAVYQQLVAKHQHFVEPYIHLGVLLSLLKRYE